MEDTRYKGIGRTERRRMKKRWREEGKPLGLSLRAWARQQHPVGDSAFAWVMAKTNKEADPCGKPV